MNFKNGPFYHLVILNLFGEVLFCSVLFCACFKKTGQRFGAVVGVLHPPLFTVERVVLICLVLSFCLKWIFAYVGLCIQLFLYVSLAFLLNVFFIIYYNCNFIILDVCYMPMFGLLCYSSLSLSLYPKIFFREITSIYFF